MDHIAKQTAARLAKLIEAWHLEEGFDAVEVLVDEDREPVVGTAYAYTCKNDQLRWYPVKSQPEPSYWETGWVAEDAEFGFRYADALD